MADDISVPNVLRQCFELIARMPIISAYSFQAKRHYFDNESLIIHRPKKELSTAENFLYMIRPDTMYTPLEAELLDLALILHAEHGGGNNSSFTIHVVTSSDTDTYAAVAAAIGSLKGPKHGGANIKVRNMMDDLKSNVKDITNREQIREYLIKVLKREAFDKSGLIYGFGHAIYTLSDPRALLLKEKAKLLAQNNNCVEEFQLYVMLEELVPEVFKEVKRSDQPISPNVDFYSGLVYSMLCIPEELYTPLFAISRMAGWAAHRIEEIVSGGKIIRPAYKSVVKKRNYIPISQRD
jgi:citrate synthase